MTTAPGVGFTGFAGLSSPFAAQPRPASPFSASSGGGKHPNRSKSPARHGAAFTPYNSAIRGFATPKSPRRKRSTSPSGSAQFTDKTTSDDTAGGIDSEIDDEKPTSFSDKLKKEHGLEQDEDPEARLELEEKEGEVLLCHSASNTHHCLQVVTGEEGEKTLYSVRAKLFTLNEQKVWTERGIGPLRLNVRKTDGGGARLGLKYHACS
jgi:Ran-binding protein 3